MDKEVELAKRLLESKGYVVNEATKKTVYAVEYYEPKVGKWIKYFKSSNLDDVKKHLDAPIIGNPKKRIAQYSVEGVRKLKYKFVKEIKGE